MPDRPAGIETERLRLVVLIPSEIRLLIERDTARASASADVMFLPGWPEASDAREGLPWHLRHLEADERHRAWRVRVIAERATNLVVGSINLKGPPTADGDVEIGWGISPTHRGRGYAFEAATAVIEWVRDQPGTKSISATIPDDNLASQHLARKLGFVRSEQLRRGLPLWQRVLRDESEVGEE